MTQGTEFLDLANTPAAQRHRSTVLKAKGSSGASASVHDDVVDIEVALAICNSLLAITNKLMDELEAVDPTNEERFAELRALQLKFAHEIRSDLRQNNMAVVRAFIDAQGPQVKRFYQAGALPAIITD